MIKCPSCTSENLCADVSVIVRVPISQAEKITKSTIRNVDSSIEHVGEVQGYVCKDCGYSWEVEKEEEEKEFLEDIVTLDDDTEMEDSEWDVSEEKVEKEKTGKKYPWFMFWKK